MGKLAVHMCVHAHAHMHTYKASYLQVSYLNWS